MAAFGERSRSRLEGCHPLLQLLFNEVVKEHDCSILCGIRSKDNQDKAFKNGKTKLRWPDSKHNIDPDWHKGPYLSEAVDVVPYPVDWNDLERFYMFGGYVRGVAFKLGIKIRWGGDWDGDYELSDNTFNDLPHFELIL